MPAARDAALADDLLLLAINDPDEAQRRSHRIIADSQDPWRQSVARHAIGLALRERGDLDGAVPELRAAVRLAAASRDADRTSDARATLGAALAMSGRSRSALTQLDRAVDEATSAGALARARMRRGYVLWSVLGRGAEAVSDFQQALVGAQATGDRLWEARTLNNLSWLWQSLGKPVAAGLAAASAERIFAAEKQWNEAAVALHNRAGAAFQQGDLPTSLVLYDEADRAYTRLGMDEVELVHDRSVVLLAAGLAAEAADVAQERLARRSLPVTKEGDLRLVRAQALLAADEGVAALAEAGAARKLFNRHGRDWFALRARLVELRAREAAGVADRRHASEAGQVARLLETELADEAAQAWLLAARLAPDSAEEAWAAAARYRGHRLPLVSATGWLAQGLAREVMLDRRGVMIACRRGLDELDRHRATLGSSELRALASRHGADLADLALRTAVEGPPRRLLSWSERWRATSLTQPRVRPGNDLIAGPVAALRDNARRLRLARERGEDPAQLETERHRLENALRSRLHQTAGMRGQVEQTVDLATLIAEVGAASFVELVEVGGTLHALVVSGGRVRRHEVGPVALADQAVAATAFTLRQAARGRAARLAEAGGRLERALLGPAARRLPGPVVVSPTSRLHGVPWGLLPSLADVPHSVVPSAALWLRARERASATNRRVFVSGPGLTTGGAEISVVAPRHVEAVVLRDGAATVDDAMGALDGAGLAHIAAHGHFRADSPLFSSLDLADGPLAVHDFERLDQAPHRVVLSACDSGVLAPVGAGELLGLVSALLAIGTAGVVASVAVVNDVATVDVMVDVHAALDAGADLATALHSARSAATDDPTRAATAAAFLALGV